MGQKSIEVDELRAALDDAIRARAWSAVDAINARLRDLERVGVVDLAAERKKRGG